MTSLRKKDALALLKKYKVNPRVMEHVLAVHDYAMEIAGNVECDRDLVEVGSLLHDIGRATSHEIDHAIIGAEILRKEGVDERIVNIVERHVGSGLTPEEAKALGLPPKDYVPKTIEEKIVCHADNLIGSTERVSIRDTVAMARKKWFPESVDRLIRMHFEVFKPDIVILNKNALEAKYGDLKGIEKSLDALLNDLDLLYKVEQKNGKYAVSLYGQDSKKAAKYLKAKLG
jgi:uncharacterized protein (TIGR00295 family)